MSEKREYDIAVFGATGFTGKLAVEYLSKNFPGDMRWVISGRNQDRIEDIYRKVSGSINPPKKFYVVDHSDQKSVFDIIKRTRLVLNFAGPFGRYGENVVAGCAQFGTHYLDITGEPNWVYKMIQKYESSTLESGAILIPFSGFDSVPSDLGVWQVLEEAKKKFPHQTVTKVISLFSIGGGVNGGSFETLLDRLAQDREEQKRTRDSSLLVPKDLKNKFRFPDLKWPIFLKEESLTAPPFFMSPINSRVVYRSQALRISRFGDEYKPFKYAELQKVSSRPSSFTTKLNANLKAWNTVLAFDLIDRIGHFSLGRKVLRKYGPKAGHGPSEEKRDSGHSWARFFAYNHQNVIARAEFSYPGDPGNKATVVMICESARCLLFDQSKLEKVQGGFLTPSTALGTALRDRLIEAGVKWTIS